MLSRHSKLSLTNEVTIYKSIIRSAITYDSSLWGYAAKSHIEQLQMVQNKILRMATNAPWFVRNKRLHSDLKIPTIEELIHKYASKFHAEIEEHPTAGVKRVADYNEEEPLRHKRPNSISKCNISINDRQEGGTNVHSIKLYCPKIQHIRWRGKNLRPGTLQSLSESRIKNLSVEPITERSLNN